MKKIVKTFLAASIFSAAGFAFAERGPAYISPNNDGIQDSLEVPIKIKEQRYVKEWSFRIYNEQGDIVRTIGNKVKLPERITFKSFFKSLFSAKTGVEIPSSVVWNGFFDDGTLAPDGIYYYEISAADDNGNESTTSRLQVIVDNTAPAINLKQLSAQEKNFGEGAKSSLRITQSGSREELWEARITDIEGKLIKYYKWEKSEPLTIEWEGADDNDIIVPDGVYNYEITATDLAGNKSEKSVINNIIFSAEKPETAVAINGSRYFSPSGNSKIKTMALDVTVPEPSSKVVSLSEWKVEIIGVKDNKVYKTYSGTSNPPKSVIVFDGNDDNGALVAEGQYRAKVTAKYSNGYEPQPVLSPAFVVDNTAPKATVVLPANKVFNGTASYDISQKGIPEAEYTGQKDWTGLIKNNAGQIVRKFDFGTDLPETVSWDGFDDKGALAPDGEYSYVVEVKELAGNSASYETAKFKLDTSKTESVISVTPSAFSPNGDGVQDKIMITPIVKASSGIKSYAVTITDSKKNVVRTLEGSGSIPKTIEWNGLDKDGKRCSDGAYSIKLSTVANSGTSAESPVQTVLLDMESPVISIEAPYLAFSPDGVSSKQKIPVSVKQSSVETKWTCNVINSKSKKIVRTYIWQNNKVSDFAWDGSDESGNKAENGTYIISVFSTDAAGNSAKAEISNIVLDTRPSTAYVTNLYDGISPNGDNYLESQKFDLKVSLTEGISAWNFVIADSNGKAVKTFSDKDSVNLPKTINWAGDMDNGNIAEGVFTGKLHVEYAKGNFVEASSGAFICTPNAPSLSVKTSPEYFSPDNDGNDDDLFIRLKGNTVAELKSWAFTVYDRNGNQFWKTSGKSSITERIIWDGRGNNGELVQSAEDYKYVFTATDNLGMTSSVEGKIVVDVLVVRDGSKLKMQVPSIIFRSDNADFGVQVVDAKGNVTKAGITKAQADNNERVLKRIAEILKKFSDYKVTIVGHANSMTGTEEEETKDNPSKWGPALQPLSEKRAQYVKEQLVKMGISSSRLSVEGKGGTEPVADRNDKTVNWKNRRVEFVLEK